MPRQIPTPSGDACPDCQQPLAGPQRPTMWHAGEPVWCATCERGGRRRLKGPSPGDAAAPDTITVEWIRALLERHGCTQREAAKLLHVDERTMRKWCCGEREMPWAAGELLRRLLLERAS